MISQFEELIRKRTDWVKSSQDNKFDFDNILSGLYNEPLHFIYEILQNAEDRSVGAKKVKFVLSKDRLDIYHNGRDFDFQDIDGVTGIGISKKKEDLTQIGKFGIGFKSVFAITSTPHIFSGKYKIKIEDFVIPSVINNDEKISGTLIQIPFNHSKLTKEEAFDLVCKKLENLELRILLFLKNIEEIEWVTPSSKGRYLKSSKSIQNKNTLNTTRVQLESSKGMEEYIVIENPIKIENKDLLVEVAFKLGKDKNGKEIIIPEKDSKLVVFFPTEKITFLNFIIQGPYKTTPNRENIPLDDEQNRIIIEETGELIAESLSVIKDLGYLDTDFLSILPIDPEKTNELIYSVLYNKVKEKLLSEELLPTSDDNYTKPKDAILADGKGLTEFLNEANLQELYSKKAWLDTNITKDTKKELREYLMSELNVVEANFESFARKITEKFLQSKSDEWMIDFYCRLSDQRALWAEGYFSKPILKTKPIIRLDTGEHIAPFNDGGEIQVYLPTETKSKYKTVKDILIKNSDSLKFLTELGLKIPDIHAEVKELILPKYQKDDVTKDKEYFDDFIKILEAYNSIPSNERNNFKRDLLSITFILSVKNDTEELSLKIPSEVYLNNNELREFFKEQKSVYFVSEELFEKCGKEKLRIFLKDLGVEDKPKHIEIGGNLTLQEKSKIRGNFGHTYDIYQKDYEYEGLENFINNGITLEKSYLLWKLLLKNIDNLNSWQAKKFFEGKYKWFYYSSYERNFVAKFLKMLKQFEWIVDKNNNFKKPSDITFSELSDNYKKEGSNIEILVKVLEFKPEIIEQLPEAEKEILKITKEEGLTPEELKMLISESKRKTQYEEEKRWAPECEPDTSVLGIQEVEPEKIITPDLSNQEESNDTGKPEKSTEDIEKLEKEVDEASIDKKAIGKWGEEGVYNTLREEYQKQGKIIETDFGFKVINSNNEEFEIVWLNKNSEIGKGYDLCIKKNGTEVKYIEVKSKTQEDPEMIVIQGTQWEFARKLFDQNEGEKYYFYVVFNTGKSNATIKSYNNPIKLWKDGKIYAHPVNFKL